MEIVNACRTAIEYVYVQAHILWICKRDTRCKGCVSCEATAKNKNAHIKCHRTLLCHVSILLLVAHVINNWLFFSTLLAYYPSIFVTKIVWCSVQRMLNASSGIEWAVLCRCIDQSFDCCHFHFIQMIIIAITLGFTANLPRCWQCHSGGMAFISSFATRLINANRVDSLETDGYKCRLHNAASLKKKRQLLLRCASFLSLSLPASLPFKT